MPPRQRKTDDQAPDEVEAPAIDEQAPAEPTTGPSGSEVLDAVRRVIRALVNQQPIEGDPVPDWLLTILRDELPPEPVADAPDICPECFPNGWTDHSATSVGCAHGTWSLSSDGK